MRKIAIGMMLGLVLGGAVWYGWFRGPGLVDHPRSGTAVVLFGDSLAYGVGASPGSDLGSVLGARLGVKIANAGRSGDAAEDGLRRLAQDVLDRDPRIVIIILGGNDILAGRSAGSVEATLGEIIDQVHARGAGVLLVGVRSADIGTESYGAMYAHLAAVKRASFVPNALSGILGNPELSADNIHPNGAGYRILADRLEPLLHQMLAGRGILSL